MEPKMSRRQVLKTAPILATVTALGSEREQKPEQTKAKREKEYYQYYVRCTNCNYRFLIQIRKKKPALQYVAEQRDTIVCPNCQVPKTIRSFWI